MTLRRVSMPAVSGQVSRAGLAACRRRKWAASGCVGPAVAASMVCMQGSSEGWVPPTQVLVIDSKGRPCRAATRTASRQDSHSKARLPFPPGMGVQPRVQAGGPFGLYAGGLSCVTGDEVAITVVGVIDWRHGQPNWLRCLAGLVADTCGPSWPDKAADWEAWQRGAGPFVRSRGSSKRPRTVEFATLVGVLSSAFRSERRASSWQCVKAHCLQPPVARTSLPPAIVMAARRGSRLVSPSAGSGRHRPVRPRPGGAVVGAMAAACRLAPLPALKGAGAGRGRWGKE